MSWFSKFFRKKENRTPMQQAYMEQKEKELSLSEAERQGYFDDILKIALMICDYNGEYKQTMQDLLSMNIDEFIVKYADLNHELALDDYIKPAPGSVSIPHFVHACVDVLAYYGYVSCNDWKFTLADMVYNFERQFERLNIPVTLFYSMPNLDKLMINNNVYLIADALPDAWRLVNWDTNSDEYNFFILKPHQVDEVIEIAKRISYIAQIEIRVIDTVEGFEI